MPPRLLTSVFVVQRSFLIGLGICFASFATAMATEPMTDDSVPLPKSPADSLATMQIEPGLNIELVAAEPMVLDPVAITWDAAGAMYVAEMGDYPAEPEGGRIRKLIDENGDGRMDRSTLFVPKIAYPTSVLPYRDGILVASAPDILWFRDTNQDDVADESTVLVTGFGQGNQQLRVNGLVWGLDGWIYGANGRSDGEVHFPSGTNDPPPTTLSIRNRDFRFHADRRAIETTGGFTQFGQSFDNYGHRFISWNTIHIRHVVMDQKYLSRNPRAPITATSHEISTEGSTVRVFPISQTTRRFNAEPPGYFNASCGLSIYRGNLLPTAYHGNSFACEPLSNLVHRDVLAPTGSTFVASRSENEPDREFLSSSDPWFRPVNTATGPDGALYIVDFYRPWVEHPQWVADPVARSSVDFSIGKDFGRIYRIVPKEPADRASAPTNLKQLPDQDLIELLSWPSSWQRETAQRLLVERGTVEYDHILLHAWNGETELERLHAMGVIYGSKNRFDSAPDAIARMLIDRSPYIRRIGLGWIEDFLSSTQAIPQGWLDRIQALVDDADPQVRLQAIATLGTLQTETIAGSLAKAFVNDGKDAWIRQAIFSGLDRRSLLFMKALAPLLDEHPSIDQDRLQWLLLVIASEARDHQSEWEAFYSSLPKHPSVVKSLVGLGLAKALGKAWVADFSLRELSFRQDLESVTASGKTDEAIASRWLNIGMLEYVESPEAVAKLKQALRVDQPLVHQLWAARSLAGKATPESDEVLMEGLATTSPAARRSILDLLISRPTSALKLAKAIAEKRVPWEEFDRMQKQMLISRLPPAESQLLSQFESQTTNAFRAQAIESYLAAFGQSNNVENGRKLYEQHCQSCHAIGTSGHRVGPDLTGVAGRSPNDLLLDILDPNRSVAADGFGFAVVTHEDEVLSGIIAGETSTSITLKKAGGEWISLLREEIRELKNLGRSLMPEGFEMSMNPDEMSDLVAYLKSSNLAK